MKIQLVQTVKDFEVDFEFKLTWKNHIHEHYQKSCRLLWCRRVNLRGFTSIGSQKIYIDNQSHFNICIDFQLDFTKFWLHNVGTIRYQAHSKEWKFMPLDKGFDYCFRGCMKSLVGIWKFWNRLPCIWYATICLLRPQKGSNQPQLLFTLLH